MHSIKCIMICHVSADSSTGTPGSLEHSLDSDSDEERARGELPPSPTEQALDSTAETQMRPPVLLVNLVCPSSPNNNSDPPALPESEPPELYEPEEAAACALAALNINQSNNITLWVSSPQPGLVSDVQGVFFLRCILMLRILQKFTDVFSFILPNSGMLPVSSRRVSYEITLYYVLMNISLVKLYMFVLVF